MSARTNIIALAAACLLAPGALAQVPAAASNPVGVWRGTSLCRVRPSPCNDEIVVYRIARVKASDSLSLDARKIVNGQEEEMGVLGCRSAAPGAQVTCTMPNGLWRFAIRGDSLVGELRLPNNTKYRDISTARSALAEETMRKVILQEFVSADSLVAGPNDSVDFIPASTQGDATLKWPG